MASTIIHMAITGRLLQTTAFRDPDRLMLGSILPDASLAGRNTGHMKIHVGGGDARTLDLDGFRARFGDLMLRDDLYLGYYLHLVEDVLHRRFMYADHGFDPRVPGYVERLHRDYGVTNAHVIEAYGLREDMVKPVDLTGQRILELGGFDIPGLIQTLHGYFRPVPETDALLFTEQMADELICKAVALCETEVAALRRGGIPLSALDWVWGG